jgi:hypothetical protein
MLIKDLGHKFQPRGIHQALDPVFPILLYPMELSVL